jgi:hypothetical protein
VNLSKFAGQHQSGQADSNLLGGKSKRHGLESSMLPTHGTLLDGEKKMKLCNSSFTKGVNRRETRQPTCAELH